MTSASKIGVNHNLIENNIKPVRQKVNTVTMNEMTRLSVVNTAWIRLCVDSDPRVRSLLVILRSWKKELDVPSFKTRIVAGIFQNCTGWLEEEGVENCPVMLSLSLGSHSSRS